MVKPDAIIHVPRVPVVDTKYWYPENHTASAQTADQARVNAHMIVAPLVGLMSVDIGVTVSRYTVIVFEMISPLVFEKVI